MLQPIGGWRDEKAAAAMAKERVALKMELWPWRTVQRVPAPPAEDACQTRAHEKQTGRFRHWQRVDGAGFRGDRDVKEKIVGITSVHTSQSSEHPGP
jgi:hypothetical protein